MVAAGRSTSFSTWELALILFSINAVLDLHGIEYDK